MKKLEEIITKEKSFLIAAGVMAGARTFDAVSTSVVISSKVDYAFHDVIKGLELLGSPSTEIETIKNWYGATFEANPLAAHFIREYGLNQGLFLQNLVVTVPVLAIAYF